MPSLIAALLFVSSVALLPGGAAPSPGDLKCSGRAGNHADMPETVVILDDRVIEVEIPDFDLDDHGLTNTDIHSFGFVCWRWIEEHHGFRVKSTGVYVVTVDWMKRRGENQRAALEALIAAQDRHRERHGKYAQEAGELPDFGSLADHGLPSYFELDLTATNDGWSARVSANTGWSEHVEYGVPKGCFAFAGAVPEKWTKAPGKDRPAFTEREPMCSDVWQPVE